MDHALPVIALRQYTTPEQLAKPLHAACTDSGFFYLTDHGAEELVKEAFKIAQEYFLQSSDVEKAKFPYSMDTGLVRSACLIAYGPDKLMSRYYRVTEGCELKTTTGFGTLTDMRP